MGYRRPLGAVSKRLSFPTRSTLLTPVHPHLMVKCCYLTGQFQKAATAAAGSSGTIPPCAHGGMVLREADNENPSLGTNGRNRRRVQSPRKCFQYNLQTGRHSTIPSAVTGPFGFPHVIASAAWQSRRRSNDGSPGTCSTSTRLPRSLRSSQ